MPADKVTKVRIGFPWIPALGDILVPEQTTSWTSTFNRFPHGILSDEYNFSTIIPRVTVDLIDIEQELFELPQKVCPHHASC